MTMVVLNAGQLCQVNFDHPAYPGRVDQLLSFRPLTPCKIIMSKFMGLLLSTPTGFRIAGESEQLTRYVKSVLKAESQEQAKANAATVLPRFPVVIEAAHPDFYQYTDLEFQPGHIYYFSNLLSGGQRSLPLHEDTFTLPVPEGLIVNTVMVQMLGQTAPVPKVEIGKVKVKSQFQVDGNAPKHFYIDLYGVDDGAYELIVNAGTNQEYTYSFFKSRELTWRQPVGVYEWGLTEKSQETPPPVVFPVKAYAWTYVVHANNSSGLDGATIQSKIQVGGQAVEFNLLEQYSEDNLRVFTSSEPLPLLPIPSGTITLITEDLPKGMPLPYGSVKNLSIQGLGTETPQSAIYCRMDVRI